MRSSRRILSLVLVLIICLSMMVTPANASYSQYNPAPATPTSNMTGTTRANSAVLTAHDPDTFTDIEGHWAEEALRNAITYGLMDGKAENVAAPDDYITRAEMAALMTRAFEAMKSSAVSTFVDMKQDMWHFSYVSRAVQMGILSGNGNAMNPNGHITRQEAAVVFARAFNLYSYKKSAHNYSDFNTVASYATEAMEACVGAGIMGVGGGTLSPTADLTRAEFASMMYGLSQVYINSAVPYTGGSSIVGSAMVTVPNVSLTNTSVGQNLYLGDGVENGSIILDNVQVRGTVYVRGGSKLSLTNGTNVGSVVVYNPSYAVIVETDATSRSGSTVIDTAVSAITLTGNVGDVTMNTAKAVLSLNKAKVGKLNAAVMLPTITVDKDSTVDSINIPASSTGAALTIEGKVKSVLVDAEAGEVKTASTANVETLDINGVSSTIELDGKLSKVIIGAESENNTISVGSSAKIDTITLLANGENDIEVSSGASIGTFAVNEPKAKMSLKLSIDDFLIDTGAKGARITFEDGTTMDTLEVKADDVDVALKRGANIRNIIVTGYNVHIIVEEGATADKIEVSGRDINVSGNGTVNTVELKPSGNNAVIDTKNTTVKNNSNTPAKVGNGILNPGEEGKTDNDGKYETTKENEDKDEDKNEGEKDSVFGMAFAGSAMSNDLYSSGSYKVSDFCANIAYDYTGRIITGTVNQVVGFPLFAGTSSDTGYYVPMVLDTNTATDDFTLKILDKVYTKADVSKGQTYNGRLLFFLPLNAFTGADTNGQKTLTVYYDADGSKTEYKEVSAVITYTQVQFVGGTESLERTAFITGAPGIGGNPALEMTNVISNSPTSFTVMMGGKDIKSVKNPNGTLGHWGGVRFVGPKDAGSVDYTVVTNGITNTYAIKATPTTVSGANQIYTAFDHYENLANVKQMMVSITWKTSTGVPIGNTETYMVDFSAVELVGAGDPGEGEPPSTADPNAIVSKFELSALGEQEVRRLTDNEYGITDFAQAYRIVDQKDESAYIAGTYYSVDYNANAGYYLPVCITVDGLKQDAKLMLGSREIYTFTMANAGAGSSSLTVLIPLNAVGAQIQDFQLRLAPADGSTAYTAVTKKVDASQAACYQAETGVMLLAATSAFNCDGKTFDNLVVSDYGLTTAGTGANLTGVFKKNTMLGGDTEVWYAPIRVANYSSKESWYIRVICGDNITYEGAVVNAGIQNADVLVPIGAAIGPDGTYKKFDTITIQMYDASTNQVMASTGLYTSGATLQGFSNEKASACIYKIAADVVDGVQVSSLIEGDSSVSTAAGKVTLTGTFKKAEANGNKGWFAPLCVKLDKPVSSWKIVYSNDGNQTEITSGLTDGIVEKHILLPLGDASGGTSKAYTTIFVSVYDTSRSTPVLLNTFEVQLVGGISSLQGF